MHRLQVSTSLIDGIKAAVGREKPAADRAETLFEAALWPAYLGRQTGQDRIDVAACLQSEDRAAIIEQVELDVTAAPHQLLLALGVGPVLVEILAHKMLVNHEERPADILGETQIRIPAALLLGRVLPVEEDAADAARFVAMRQEEVFVA